MPAPDQPTDANGFRIPQRFEQDAPPGPLANPYRGRIRVLLLILLVLAVSLLARDGVSQWGRGAMARYYQGRARTLAAQEEYAKAIAELDRGIAWQEKNVDSYFLRAQLHGEVMELDRALADYTRTLELLPKSSEGESWRVLMARSNIYQRQHKVQEALDDLNQAAKFRGLHNATLLNARAYARAVFNVELDEALADIEQALAWLDGKLDPEGYSAMLDTRGYVYFRLGRHAEAMQDIEEAIRGTEQQRERYREQLKKLAHTARDEQRLEKRFNRHLAVMYHHRGEIHEQLGNASQAAADLSRAKELGYNHEAGVF